MSIQSPQQNQLAVALGVSASVITRDKARGMPTNSIEAARQWRKEHVRARVLPGQQHHPALPKQAQEPAIAGDSDDGNYWQSRARREAAEAELAELKLAEQRGDLMRREVAQREVSSLAAAFRDALMQSKARLVPLLLDVGDARQIDQLLDSEYRLVLSRSAAV